MRTLFSLLLSFLSVVAIAQTNLTTLPNFEKYKTANDSIKKDLSSNDRVIFIGNSVTEGWANTHPDFFSVNNYIGRGISGQTSPQLLLRFRKDVIDLHPRIVVIHIGINDIAENTGDYNPEFTMDNIKSMAELALSNNIEVILASVLPSNEIPWRKEVKDISQKINDLNKAIKQYAYDHNIPYANYNEKLKGTEDFMPQNIAGDGVHPTSEGYVLMESVIQPIISKMK